MARAEGLVGQVQKRLVGANNDKTLYEISAVLEGVGDGGSNMNVKLTTFDANIAGAARKRENQDGGGSIRSAFDYKVEQKGQYTNYYLNGIAAPGELAEVDDIPEAPRQQNRGGGGGGYKGGGGRTEQERKSIVKQNVLRTASDFVSKYDLSTPEGEAHFAKAKDAALAFAAELFEIAKEGPGITQVEPTVIPSTPAEVATEVPGVQVGTEGVVTTDQTPAKSDGVWD